MSSNKFLRSSELLKPENMILLYSRGAFPMAEEDGEIHWYLPEIRTVIPLNDYNIPRSLRKVLEESEFEYKIDCRIEEIIENCANRERTWISERLIEAYKGLIKLGHVHSVEVYLKGKLVGGLYGVTYKGAFFGESMFSKVSQASKAALVFLIKHLNEKRFKLLDVQFLTPHLKMFGAKEISHIEFMNLQIEAFSTNPSFSEHNN
jgi:leucyl/phenylalanyl-tRNA--protein transferase